MCGQHKEVARECLSWKSFCVSNIEEIISEFKDSQHNLENTVTFIHDNKRVFNESHGCLNTNSIRTTQWPFVQKPSHCPN